MRILIVPDSFKGTYTARQVADAIAHGVRDAGGDPVRLPGADGGEGTLEALTAPLELRLVTIPAVDPWRAAVAATYGLSPSGTAVIEVASASGYRTDAAERPRAAVDADTYGTGLLIADAITKGPDTSSSAPAARPALTAGLARSRPSTREAGSAMRTSPCW